MTECKDEHILNSIDYPEDLRKLSPDKLGEVCAELRQCNRQLYRTETCPKMSRILR